MLVLRFVSLLQNGSKPIFWNSNVKVEVFSWKTITQKVPIEAYYQIYRFLHNCIFWAQLTRSNMFQFILVCFNNRFTKSHMLLDTSKINIGRMTF